MNFNIYHDRNNRVGFPEVVYGKNKNVATILKIIKEIYSNNEKVLITKLQKNKFVKIKEEFENIFYDPISKICIVGNIKESRKLNP